MTLESVTARCNMCKEDTLFEYNFDKSKLNNEVLYTCKKCGADRPYENLKIKEVENEYRER